MTFLHSRFKEKDLSHLIAPPSCNGIMFRLLKKSSTEKKPLLIDVATEKPLNEQNSPQGWDWKAKDDYVRDAQGCLILIGTPTYDGNVSNRLNYVAVGENLPKNRKGMDFEYLKNFRKKFNVEFFWKVQIQYLLAFQSDVILSGVMAFFGSNWYNYKGRKMRSQFFLMKAVPEIIPLDPATKKWSKGKSFQAYLSPMAPIAEPFFQLAQPCPPEWDDGEGEV